MLNYIGKKNSQAYLSLDYDKKPKIFNRIIETIDGKYDKWLLYEYQYAPPRNLKKNVKIEIENSDRLYYQCLEHSLWKKSEEFHRGQSLEIYEHGIFYKAYKA